MLGQLISGIAASLIAAVIGAIAGFFLKKGYDRIKKARQNKAIIDLFGLKNKAKVYILHTAIFDNERKAYNYPSCDMRVVRIVASLLESVGKKEGMDFFISAENEEIRIKENINDDVLSNSNLVFICGPKRNNLLSRMIRMMPKLRFELSVDARTGENLLYDDIRKTHLLSSCDDIGYISQSSKESESISGFDYALILSIPNPMNPQYTMVVLAGIHGSGTLGAGIFVSDQDKLSELIGRRRNGIIQEIIISTYRGNPENIIKVAWT